MNPELRAVINEISGHNPALAEAVVGFYHAIYETSELTKTANPAKAPTNNATSSDAAQHVVDQVGKNDLMTDDGTKINGLAERSGRDGDSLLSSDEEKELNEISYNTAVNDFNNPEKDPLALPSTEDLIPPDALPQGGGQPAPEEPDIPDEEDDDAITSEDASQMGMFGADEMSDNPLGDISDEELQTAFGGES